MNRHCLWRQTQTEAIQGLTGQTAKRPEWRCPAPQNVCHSSNQAAGRLCGFTWFPETQCFFCHCAVDANSASVNGVTGQDSLHPVSRESVAIPCGKRRPAIGIGFTLMQEELLRITFDNFS